jgi:hypothetical protein
MTAITSTTPQSVSLRPSYYSNPAKKVRTDSLILFHISDIRDRRKLVLNLRYVCIITLFPFNSTSARYSSFTCISISLARTHRLNLRVVLKHDLVIIVHITELLLGDIDPSPGDVKDFTLLKHLVEIIHCVVESCCSDFTLSENKETENQCVNRDGGGKIKRAYCFIHQSHTEQLSLSSLITPMFDL